MFMDLLIFDMDGVLIDVSRSYRKTIQQTIHIYLKHCLGLRANLVSHEEISFFKSAGGFNNDWDLTSGFLLYLLSISKVPPLPKQKKFSFLDAAVLYLRQRLSNFHQRKALCLKRTHLSSFLEQVKASGGGLKGVQSVQKGLWDGWVYRSGDINQENLVKRIFQEIYLGNKFSSHYHLQPLFYRDKGLYLREKLLIERKVLSSLRKKMKLGIASGRPRFEAELALKRFRLTPYFDSVVTLDECEEEEGRTLKATGKRVKLTKPHPYSLLKVIGEMGISNPQCGYVGDVVDDMRAARAARKESNVLAIGFLGSHTNRKETEESLRHAGADLVIETPAEFLRLF
ncbi:MAG: HAD family hydrolase [Deltaproteobacteria bacterium]|nr:HAD family hydrolase [Deltaproteobacteria bacterium]